MYLFIRLFFSNHSKNELLVVFIVYFIVCYVHIVKLLKKYAFKKKRCNLFHYSKSAKTMREFWLSETDVKHDFQAAANRERSLCYH